MIGTTKTVAKSRKAGCGEGLETALKMACGRSMEESQKGDLASILSVITFICQGWISQVTIATAKAALPRGKGALALFRQFSFLKSAFICQGSSFEVSGRHVAHRRKNKG